MVRGLMGGTFDPIHLGHMLIARAALEELALDSVLFLPDGDPPHKQPRTAPMHRLRMAQLACEGEPRFQVSDMELKRKGRTYTVDTLLALKAINPQEDLVYLVGSDTLLLFPTWRTADKVAQLCRMAVVMRPGDDRQAVTQAQADFARRYGLQSQLLARQGLNLSSSQVRQAVEEGQPIEGLVPTLVADYIRSHGLYQPPGQGEQASSLL